MERYVAHFCKSVGWHALRDAALTAAVAGAVLVSTLPLAAQTPDASDIAEGARLFRQKGNCQSCHGWAGDGRKMDEQMPDICAKRASTVLHWS
jgi:mono/diheme cytochrome c family protein